MSGDHNMNQKHINQSTNRWGLHDGKKAAQREWVGLTDDDLSVCDEDGVVLARYWEAKLKEKNT